LPYRQQENRNGDQSEDEEEEQELQDNHRLQRLMGFGSLCEDG
jgi:hypothetical protein